MTWQGWPSEAAMVADFSAWASQQGWIVYAETAGWDLLLVRTDDGFQIGVEAKLSLNAKVLCQVIEHDRYGTMRGPDCHAVLVPAPKAVNGLSTIAAQLGITVIEGHGPDENRWGRGRRGGPYFRPDLPQLGAGRSHREEAWPERCPDQRCDLPDYIPDVTGGKSAPVALTPWKIKAIKVAIVLEVKGFVTRAEIKALGIDPSRWTQYWLKSNGAGGWRRTKNMPDFKSQHPINYEQIKADIAKWLPAGVEIAPPQTLFPGAVA